MNRIEHEALMDDLNAKRRDAILLIVFLIVAFALYYFFGRGLLKALI